MKANLDKLEKLGRLRFESGSEFDKAVNARASYSVQRMISNLADNYPDIDTSRIASVYKAFCEERERALSSLSDIYDDNFYNSTRPEYLFQILGDLLFINEKAGGVQYTDETYRDFLIKVKNAYLGGSGAENINNSLSDILGIPVNLKLMYLEARKSNNPTTILDTHRMLADIFLTNATNSEFSHLSTIIQDLYFFVGLIKPAHALFETRLIWEEEILIAGCDTDGFAMDGNGNTYNYVYSDLSNKVYSLYRLAWVPDGSDIIGEDWVKGKVQSIDPDAGVITLDGGTELVISNYSYFYKYFEDEEGTFRIDLDELAVGVDIWFFGLEAPGSFNFYDTPSAVVNNWYAQFDPDVIESTSFQSRVLRERDASGSVTQNRSCPNALQIADNHRFFMYTGYEDMRDNCEYPSPKLYKEIFETLEAGPSNSGEGYQDVPGSASISEELNVYTLERVPLANKDGGLAGIGDVVLYVNNIRVEDGIKSIEPWEGDITLNFLPPAGSEVRFDYYHQDVYPELVEEEFSLGTVGESQGSDIPAYTEVYPQDSYVIRFQWPFIPGGYKAEEFDNAIPDSYDDLDYEDDLSQVENASFASPETRYDYLGDSSSVQLNLFPVLDYKGDLAKPEDIIVYVDGVEIAGAVEFLRPLLGHLQLTFIPPAGSILSFKYYYQKNKRSYPFMLDSDQHLLDTEYGVNSSYELLPDVDNFTSENENLDKYVFPAEFGYRFYAFDLGHSSVWNSKDTFSLNDFQVPGIRGSYKGTASKLNNFRLQQSGEFLYDTNKYVELNDKYIFNDLEPLIKLRGGIPPFYRSFTSWANYRFKKYVEETESTYTENLDGALDVAADVSVVSTPSGLVEYIPVPEYFSRDSIKHYAGTEESITVEGDEGIYLSSICEDRGFDLDLMLREEYYPNRELRLNDYRDYVDRMFSGYVEGELYAENGSQEVKSSDENWSEQQVGTTFIITTAGIPEEFTIEEVLGSRKIKLDRVFNKGTGYHKYMIPSGISGLFQAIRGSDVVKSVDQNWLRLRKGTILTVKTEKGNFEFTVAKVLNDQTLRLDRKFPLLGGLYDYETTFSYVSRVDVLLNNVVRKVTADLSGIMPYYGNKSSITFNPWVLHTRFPDPDPDPYPRNDFGTPVAPPLLDSEISDEGGREEFLWDEETADKLVKFRNWDQDLTVVSMGLLQEPFVEGMDDNADSIVVLYWDVHNQEFEEYAFRGSIMITSESQGVVAASAYPNALIKLKDYNDTDGLNETNYELKNTVIRQLLPDNTVDIITIEEFVRVSP